MTLMINLSQVAEEKEKTFFSKLTRGVNTNTHHKTEQDMT